MASTNDGAGAALGAVVMVESEGVDMGASGKEVERSVPIFAARL
jgi:hypothetical protein